MSSRVTTPLLSESKNCKRERQSLEDRALHNKLAGMAGYLEHVSEGLFSGKRQGHPHYPMQVIPEGELALCSLQGCNVQYTVCSITRARRLALVRAVNTA